MRIVRTSKKSPKLHADEVAVRVNVTADQNLFSPPQVALKITAQNIIRPEVKVSQG